MEIFNYHTYLITTIFDSLIEIAGITVEEGSLLQAIRVIYVVAAHFVIPYSLFVLIYKICVYLHPHFQRTVYEIKERATTPTTLLFAPNPAPFEPVIVIPHLRLCEQVIQKFYPPRDLSHDIHHIWRVIKNALIIAKYQNWEELELEPPNLLLVTCAALLHDLNDSKYRSDGFRDWTQVAHSFGLDPAEVEPIVNSSSWSARNKDEQIIVHTSEAYCVYDGDMLDAIGAYGLARVIGYSAAKGNNLDSAFEHIHSKLMQLEMYMFTPFAIELAKKRTLFLHNFFEQLKQEVIDLEIFDE